jgi:Protein of unknown function (DUF3105)
VLVSLRRVVFALAFALAPFGVAFVACGGSTTPNSNILDGGFVHPDAVQLDRARLDEPYHPEASCLVTIESPPLLDAIHVPIGTDVQYNSNPPSSGPHYPIWAAFQEYQDPVDRRYYVHDLEHGAIVFEYNCALVGDAGTDGGDGGTCDTIVQGLRQAVSSIPDDPLCKGTAVRVRTVITPDPLIVNPVAASAWGFTYNAACLDLPTLIDFANKHYGQGTEPVCANGTTTF